MIRLILLFLSAVVAAISAVTHWWILPIAVVLYIVTLLPVLQRERVGRRGDADQTGAAIVLSVVTGIVVLHAGANSLAVWEIALALSVVHAAHLSRHVLRVLVFRRWRGAADWRNVRVDAPTPRRVLPLAGPTLATIPAWILAPALAAYHASDLLYLVVGIVCLALMFITLVPLGVALLANLRMPSEQARLRALTAAMREIGPEVIVHFNAPATSAYAINDWISVLETVNRTHPVVILTVDREPWHLETTTTTTLPLVHLTGAEAIEYFVEQVPSLVLALYPRTTSPNKNLLRVPGLYDVFIGDGESDKPESANPSMRAFDEVWVAGDAGRQRFLGAGIGVRDEQVRITGRPQVSALVKLSQLRRTTDRKSVVYAPTWGGYYASDGYSSVELMGERVIERLLARDDVSVSYVPHPALGSLDRAEALASSRIVSKLSRGRGSVVIAGALPDRQAAIAHADLLITDVSTDLVDFLALDRPYIVLNPHGRSSTPGFTTGNPSASAGDVVDLDGLADLGQAIDRALGLDSRSGDRVSLAGKYLGDPASSVERFVSAVEACLDHVHTTIPARALPEDVGELEASAAE